MNILQALSTSGHPYKKGLQLSMDVSQQREGRELIEVVTNWTHTDKGPRTGKGLNKGRESMDWARDKMDSTFIG